jgi:hypothetical protein
MKKKSLYSIVLIFYCINHLCGQNEDYLTKASKTEAQELIEALKSDNKTSKAFSNSLERAITNYYSFHYYAPNLAEELFELILKQNRPTKNEYYRFLLLNAEYFSDLQLDFIQADVARVLNKSDYQFYDIISIYHLNAFKAIIDNEIDTTYFEKLRHDFMNQGISIGFLEKARPIITLANLGEVSLEDSIINIVGEFYTRCLAAKDSLTKNEKYVDLYFGVIPRILGKLNSKRSLTQTAYLMLDTFVNSLDENSIPVYELYIDFVVSPKVSRPDQRKLLNRKSEIRQGKLAQKEFVDKLYFQIKNDSLNWKKTLNDADK